MFARTITIDSEKRSECSRMARRRAHSVHAQNEGVKDESSVDRRTKIDTHSIQAP